MTGPPPVEGGDRSALLSVQGYEVLLDLSGTGDTFRSRSVVRFRCRRESAGVIADLHAAEIESATLNGATLDAGDADRHGRLELPRLAGENALVVEATVPYSGSGTGMQRAAGPCVYGKGNKGGAARMFCCFDEPDLRAPINLSVKVPPGWSCRANYPAVTRGADGGTGLWRFAETPPFAPYLVALCAGPENVLATSAGGPVPLTVWAPAGAGDAVRAELVVDLAARSVRHHGYALDTPYPYPKCDLAFVPGLQPLAYAPAGIGLLQDRLLDPTTEEPAAYLACVASHEMAHAWFGGVVDLRLESEQWVQEALATYLGRAALEVLAPGTDPWDPATSAALPDHAYAEDAAFFRELEDTIGRRGLLGALAALMHRHRFGTATLDDLARACLETTGRDVGGWAAAAGRRGMRAD